MKASQIAAKVSVRLFLFLILLALVPVFTGTSVDKQLQGIYLITNNKWVLAFPILLIAGFVTLLIICTIKKYTKPDLNWLLVVNTVMLIAYGITVFIRVSHFIK
jgi:cytochrome c biogenesis protein CcdA